MTAADTRDDDRAARICNNCWQRRAAPRDPTCTFCTYYPRRYRANATWADLIAQVDAELAAAHSTTTDSATTHRKAS